MSLTETQARLRALQPIAAEMKEVSDAAREMARKTEEELATLGIGIPATLSKPFFEGDLKEEFEDRAADETERSVAVTYDDHLGYRRHLGDWKLVVVRYRCIRGVETSYNQWLWDVRELSVTPLLESPSELILAAEPQIDELLDMLRQKAEVVLKSVENTAKDT